MEVVIRPLHFKSNNTNSNRKTLWSHEFYTSRQAGQSGCIHILPVLEHYFQLEALYSQSVTRTGYMLTLFRHLQSRHKQTERPAMVQIVS